MNPRIIAGVAVAALAGLSAAGGALRVHAAPTSAFAPVPAQVRPAVPRRTPAAALIVFVAGAVTRPGVYRLPPGSRAEAALRAAGGARSGADPVAVNLAAPVHDGDEIVVPLAGAVVARPGGAASTAHRIRAGGRAANGRSARPAASGRRRKAVPPEPVDLNTADAVQLEALPGIGPRLAARIVAFRDANGPFAALDELLDVNGVSERLLDELAPYVSAGR